MDALAQALGFAKVAPTIHRSVFQEIRAKRAGVSSVSYADVPHFRLQNPHAERRQRELGRELGGGVADVERGVHLDHVESHQQTRLGDHLHQQVSFPIVESSLDRRSDCE